ncbi:MAG: ABC transporter substrate-binding protein [Shewanella sp.]|nr:ABC transporter substrate-binding protein [Shewanella sp.]MCF1429380.1 ABC transporter substrate-binding protein [Shewanella sp.]MCF1438939.1 ABC transporter substrate-binding protein [Shewanella sp.]MCF1456048.1 ABC transporter substrate-binding protein [Shewanella sp.]
MFKQVMTAAMGLMLLGAAHSATAAAEVNTQNPYIMMETVANQTFDRFKSDKVKIDADRNYLKVIVEEVLMPHVDYRYAGLKAMGRYVRDASPEQRQAFVDAFRAYLITTYADALSSYTDQTIEFAPARKFDDAKDVRVYVKIAESGRPDIKLEFRLRKQKDDSWKAYDLKAEGVSILRTKTEEFDGLIRQYGLDKVIQMLKDKAAEPVQAKQEQGHD